MTVLAAQHIRERCDGSLTDEIIAFTRRDMITPFYDRGVCRGRSFGLSSAGYDIRIDKVNPAGLNRCQVGSYIENSEGYWEITLQPGDFILASSVERIKMPTDLICIVHDKSSWAREGLALQNTVLEPGWEGYITLELSVHKSSGVIKIQKGDPIAQLIFHKLSAPTEQPYRGKYQNQADRPVEAILETSNT